MLQIISDGKKIELQRKKGFLYLLVKIKMNGAV